MSDGQQIKEHVLQMAAMDVEKLFSIIGDLGFIGYKISLCKLKGYSLKQCANKFHVSKSCAQRSYKKCIVNRYDIHLKRIFSLN